MREINVRLTLDETNLILEALGELPFARVHQLIANIQQQAHSQLQAMQETNATDNPTGGQNERER